MYILQYLDLHQLSCEVSGRIFPNQRLQGCAILISLASANYLRLHLQHRNASGEKKGAKCKNDLSQTYKNKSLSRLQRNWKLQVLVYLQRK
jgi:hypothetical protein